MVEYFVKRPLRRPPTHPGAILRQDVLPALGLSVAEAARRLGISRQQLHRVLAETHPLSTEMALRIARLEGNTPDLWLRMQQAYDLWHIEQQLQDELAKIKPVASINSSA
jgi:addiction module HigA family antidote